MFVPASFQMSDTQVMHAFMRQHSFAILVSQGDDGMSATHLPVLLDSEAGVYGTLLGHMARANPQWRSRATEALIIFPGPHAYISPTWYQASGMVPTWNYVTVHAYGSMEIVEDPNQLHGILKRLVDTYEQALPAPWSYDVDDEKINNMLKGIVGFRIQISRLEGKAKLGQNHPVERRQKVIEALKNQSAPDSRSIADLMEATLDG